MGRENGEGDTPTAGLAPGRPMAIVSSPFPGRPGPLPTVHRPRRVTVAYFSATFCCHKKYPLVPGRQSHLSAKVRE